MEMRSKLIAAILIGIFVLGLTLTTIRHSLFIGITLGFLAGLMVFLMWGHPGEHKGFSASDKLKVSIVFGGSGHPELWTPDMPHKKAHRRKHK